MCRSWRQSVRVCMCDMSVVDARSPARLSALLHFMSPGGVMVRTLDLQIKRSMPGLTHVDWFRRRACCSGDRKCPKSPSLKLVHTATPDSRHDTDRTVLSCLVWRCELSRPDRPTGAFCVWSVSECVGRRSATAGRTPTQNALVRRSIHTATPDKTRLPRLPVDRRRDASQAESYA